MGRIEGLGSSGVRHVMAMAFLSVWLGTCLAAAEQRADDQTIRALIATATGDPGDAGYFPLNAVRWLTPPRDLAVLVTESGTSGFAAELFHFGKDSRVMSVELYLLAPGEYTMTLTDATTGRNAPVKSRPVAVKGTRTRVAFELPSCRLVVLKVARK